MALHLNFYHEIQAQKIQQQRDPLKIGLALLALLAAIFLVFYLLRWSQVTSLSKRVAIRSSEWAQIEPQLIAARARKTEAEPKINAAETVVRLVENRILWAPILQMLLEQTPRHVQINRLSASPGGSGVQIQMSGVIAGKEPRISADEFRAKLAQVFGASFPDVNADFTQLEDRPEEVALNGQSLKTASFGINVTFSLPKQEAPAPAGP